MNKFFVKIELLWSRFCSFYKRIFWTYEHQAKSSGVNLGVDNMIACPFWQPAEPYLITIGNHCQITSGVKFFTHGGGGAVRKQYPKFDTFGKIVIGDYVYIGSNSLIMPGVQIEDNVLIGAGSVVTKSVPSDVVVAGNPAKIICTTDDYLNKNLKYNTNTKGLSKDAKKKFLLSMSENRFIVKKMMS